MLIKLKDQIHTHGTIASAHHIIVATKLLHVVNICNSFSVVPKCNYHANHHKGKCCLTTPACMRYKKPYRNAHFNLVTTMVQLTKYLTWYFIL
jgi:hypothetical protein